MSHRRNPLSSLPNAANSPYRAVTAAATKRSRGDAALQEDSIYDAQPPAKRPTLGSKGSNFRTPPRKPELQSGDDGLFGKKAPNRKPTTFDRKLLAARQPQKAERQGKPPREATKDIEAWQRHYRKVFPLFVFYFENVPEDARMGCSRGIRSLGAREEKFFSKDVTHIITTRAVPSKSDTSPTEPETSSSKVLSSQSNSQPRTINPSLLDRQVEPSSNGQQQSSNKFLFETSLGKKSMPSSRGVDVEQKKAVAGSVDILQKAHGMGIKVWQLEKLQRILNTMSDGARESLTQTNLTTRGLTQSAGGKTAREVDLSHMLRNEQQYGPSDRDHGVFADELVPFRGYYIYIRDMDEKTKPILMKEYSKPPRGEVGEWPQFHANNPGKCPFVEDHSVTRQDQVQNACQRLKEERAKLKAEAQAAPGTRAETATEEAKAENPSNFSERKPLTESKSAANKMCGAAQDLPARESCPPPGPVQVMSENNLKTVKMIPAPSAPRCFGGEPAASGLQPSNVTSAIRSQVISSTAAAPGAKAGTSKEVHGLKRKVLEKNSAPALHGIQAGLKPASAAVPARAEQAIPVTRQSRRRAQEKLVNIEEESTQSEDDEDKWIVEGVPRGRARAKVIQIKRKEAKPGYCENCREKYDDFDDHIVGRKHRKFALSRDPWIDLDRLLSQLGRPLKEEESSMEAPEEPSDDL